MDRNCGSIDMKLTDYRAFPQEFRTSDVLPFEFQFKFQWRPPLLPSLAYLSFPSPPPLTAASPQPSLQSSMSTPPKSIHPPLKLKLKFKSPLLPNFGHIPQIRRCTFVVQSSHSQNPPPNPKTLDLISVLRVVPDWTDRVKEQGMLKKKELYTHETWLQHRSSLRHVRHLASSLSSRVIISLIPPVAFFTSVAVFIAAYNTAVSSDLLPEYFPVLRSSSLPYQLTASALALLLVFRTEASYSRFEEARKAWNKVISGGDDFARQVISNVDGLVDSDIKKALLQYIMAFPFALKCHLVYGSDIRKDLQNILDADDLEVVISSKHRPRCIIEFISQSIQLLNMAEAKRLALESKIGCFHEGVGVCEELEGVPIPLAYTRLTSRFLFLWHLTLPIILWDECHWIVVPATFISAASLFCIEEVGVLIEEPFPMLALDALCMALMSNIQEVMASEKTIREQVDSKRKKHCVERSGKGPNGWPGSHKT